MTQIESSDLIGFLREISVQTVEGSVTFDRPAPVRHLATATLRGLAGHLLTRVAPDLTGKYFKPGQGNHLPPAYLFQPLFGSSGTDSGFPFRIVTWDREGELLPAFINGLTQSPGYPFGETGAKVHGIEFASPEKLCFSGVKFPGPLQKLYLHTPVRLKSGEGWVSENKMTIGHIVKGAVNRLNTLSEFYGSGEKIDPLPFMAEVSLVREVARNLRWVSPYRRSSAQGRAIALSGVVGELRVRGLSPELVSLLSSIAIFHIGRHTAEGCGHLICLSS